MKRDMLDRAVGIFWIKKERVGNLHFIQPSIIQVEPPTSSLRFVRFSHRSQDEILEILEILLRRKEVLRN